MSDLNSLPFEEINPGELILVQMNKSLEFFTDYGGLIGPKYVLQSDHNTIKLKTDETRGDGIPSDVTFEYPIAKNNGKLRITFTRFEDPSTETYQQVICVTGRSSSDEGFIPDKIYLDKVIGVCKYLIDTNRLKVEPDENIKIAWMNPRNALEHKIITEIKAKAFTDEL